MSSVLIPIFQTFANPKFSSQCFLMSKICVAMKQKVFWIFLHDLLSIWIIVSYITVFIPFQMIFIKEYNDIVWQH